MIEIVGNFDLRCTLSGDCGLWCERGRRVNDGCDWRDETNAEMSAATGTGNELLLDLQGRSRHWHQASRPARLLDDLLLSRQGRTARGRSGHAHDVAHDALGGAHRRAVARFSGEELDDERSAMIRDSCNHTTMMVS